MRFTRIPSLFLIFCIIIISSIHCSKKDQQSTLVQDNKVQFLQVPINSPSFINRIKHVLSKQNEKFKFLTTLERTEGLPVWDKYLVYVSKLAPNKRGVLDTIAIIPLVANNSKIVSSFLVCKVLADTVLIKLIRGRLYKTFGFNKRTDSITANAVVSQLMYLQTRVFGDTTFLIRDSRLFNYTNSSGVTIKPRFITIHVKNFQNAPNLLASITYTECYTQVYDGDQGQLVGVEPGGTNDYSYSETVCYTSTVWFDDSGGSSSGSVNEGTTSGGGSYTDPTSDPCAKKLGARLAPGDDPCGGSLGWEPVPIDQETTYLLTDEDIAIYNEIRAEDAEADNVFNKDCQGTNRSGNIQWPGTLEHWLLMVDYVSQNPLVGEVEYQIPNSSASGNKGYADMVNIETGEIFEIKPDNPTGLSSGQSELARYVTQANINCPRAAIYTNRYWMGGTNYASRVLPYPKDLTKSLVARLGANGVVLYRTELRTTVPQPIVLPQSVLDKLKTLIEKITKNVNDSERTIAQYLRENPDLVNYIKGAAVSAAIGIIVGTIVEDFLTAGGGIADDWASFALAYKIVRFAWKM